MMMDRLVTDADATADAHLMMIGDPEYYGRFWDFWADATGGWKAPGPVDPRRLLMRQVQVRGPGVLQLGEIFWFAAQVPAQWAEASRREEAWAEERAATDMALRARIAQGDAFASIPLGVSGATAAPSSKRM